MSDWVKQYSSLDKSVSWVKSISLTEMLECRFVIRETPIIYVSTMYGCDQSCKMCHLTQSGQTSNKLADYNDVYDQVKIVLDYMDSLGYKKCSVHINFMARGEPVFWINEDPLKISHLQNFIRMRGYHPIFKISTIIPKEMMSMDFSHLQSLVRNRDCDIYYSLYSTTKAFRKKWLPKAAPVDFALSWLSNYQKNTGKIITIHHAYIEGENDDMMTITDTFEALREKNIYIKHNVVRFNPYSVSKKIYNESRNVENGNVKSVFKSVFPNGKIKIKPRVGFDIKASCGMFMGCADDV